MCVIRCQGAAISSALCCLPPLPPGWLGGIDLRLHSSRLNKCQPLQCPRMTMASRQLFFNIFHCCSVSEMFFCGFTLGRLSDYIIVRYDYDYVYVSMAFPTAAFPRVQRKMVIVILHAGAPSKNTKIQTQVLQPRSLIVSVHGQYYHVPSWDQTHVNQRAKTRSSFAERLWEGWT